MSTSEDFSTFCGNLSIPTAKREDISARYKRITRALNVYFYSSDSETANSWYVGSYGRGTAITGMSDLDVLFQLPAHLYSQYNGRVNNGQSQLLQSVKDAMQTTYPTSKMGGDGQVVLVEFVDGITFEVVPAFKNSDYGFTHPDSNDGGKWRVTDPFPEINAVRDLDGKHNGNLKRLCRMTRAWRGSCSVALSGLAIDTLAARFLSNWAHSDKSYSYYHWMARDFLAFLKEEDPNKSYWKALGSGQYVYNTGNFEYKAKTAYNRALTAIEHEGKGQSWSARQTWREIFGNAFPA